MKKIFGFGRMRALVALLCGVFVFLTLGACASTSKVYKRGSASANGEIIGTVETDLSLYIPVYYQWNVDKLLGEAHKVLLTEARKQYKGNIDVDDIVFGKRKFLLSFFIPAGGYVQSIKLTGNVFLIKSVPSVATPTPPTGTSAIPVQAALVQLPLEKIFVGGTPPQGTRDDYAAVLPTLNDALDWLDIYTKDGGNYAIVLGSDHEANKVVLEYEGKRVTITLAASGGGRTVKSDGDYSFTVEKGVTFMLEEGVTLSGRSVRIIGTFIMNGGTLRDARNGAVRVDSGGTFTMNGGTISGNSAVGGSGQSSRRSGGGVYVSGTFTMNGGTISGNTAGEQSLASTGGYGGGVYISGGTFTMNGGDISGNSAIGAYAYMRDGGYGGGVYVDEGAFTMNGGTISGNSTTDGGGVCLYVQSTFTMTGGIISGNKSRNGGGVYMYGGGVTFTMSGGTISGNESNNGGGVYGGGAAFTMNGGDISENTAVKDYWTGGGNGGGVYVSSPFTMNGGTIGGNSASINGGGVYVEKGETFTKSATAGIIYGSNAPAGQANKAPSEAAGHAVYVAGERPQKRTTTAGETTALDSRKNLVQGGGWE